jgi:two-component system sensor histidine kinase QseC
MALALPLLALGVWWAVRWGVAPLRGLRDAVARREPHALEPLSSAGAPSELVPVVEALNALFARIATLLESERRFTADAAHELRTPIAAIRAQAQVALSENDAARRHHALAATIEGADRLARLVDQLLTLSRLEAASGPGMERVDLAAIARRVAAEIAPAALAREQSLELDAETPAPIRGNDPLLGVLVRNLLDNAVRYSPRGARVRVSVAREGGRISLRVEDSGPGMNDADRARLGERFFRALGTEESGSGLGWSIVRRIAATHGMEVVVGLSEMLGGLKITISEKAL